jgi:hypothetical protein
MSTKSTVGDKSLETLKVLISQISRSRLNNAITEKNYTELMKNCLKVVTSISGKKEAIANLSVDGQSWQSIVNSLLLSCTSPSEPEPVNFKDWLASEGVDTEYFWEQCKRKNNKFSYNPSRKGLAGYKSRHWLTQSFSWYHSIKGESYWKGIDDKWQELLETDPKTTFGFSTKPVKEYDEDGVQYLDVDSSYLPDVDESIEYQATDETGNVYLYPTKPTTSTSVWLCNKRGLTYYSHLDTKKHKNPNKWKKSLRRLRIKE